MNFYNESELNSMKLADITDFYNGVAKQLGLKAVKKFRDKATAVKRTVEAQELLREELAEKQPEPVKPAPKAKKAKAPKGEQATGSRFDLTQNISIVKGEPKEGTIEHSLFAAINEGLCTTAGEVVDYIVANHKRPRSGHSVDTQYAIHNIKWFVRKGHLALS